MALVILTGASGSGKTAIAEAIEHSHPTIAVFRFDSIGVPSREVMDSFGDEDQPGGAWQRAMTLRWIERIAPLLAENANILFEGQMRIAFIREALAATRSAARVVCVECDDTTRTHRLTHERRQPELANESMMGWSRYLHQEALDQGYEILDTTDQSLEEKRKKRAVVFPCSVTRAVHAPRTRRMKSEPPCGALSLSLLAPLPAPV